MNRYAVSSLIGEGSFGRVYKATRKIDGQVVAIKIISKRGRSSKELKSLRRECEIQAHLKHPNIIEMLESFETKNDLVVVTEFALIDLHRYTSRNGTFTEEAAQRLIVQLVSALYYLHSNRILHRDLKPQNVLLNEDLHAKLCDFGLARNMTMGTHVLTSIKGTPLYMAPELLAERPYDHQADLWSLGCISYESIVGHPPFCTTSILHLVKLIKHEEVKWPSFLSSACCSFLQGLLEKDPSLRISWAQILSHPFVEGKLIISGIKADKSPFINPSANKKASKANQKAAFRLDDIGAKFEALNIAQSPQATSDNVISSRDSINAIPPSDVEQLETDIEDHMTGILVPFTENFYKDNDEPVSCGERSNMASILATETTPAVNSDTCFVSGNSNMILNHLNDNFAVSSLPEAGACGGSFNGSAGACGAESCTGETTSKGKFKLNMSFKKSRNKDLEKRKLNQNLENFSLRLGQNADNESVQRKSLEGGPLRKDKCKEKCKGTKALTVIKSSNQTRPEKHSTENSPPCLLPGWDSCDESQSPPIENEEWLAFLYRSMEEVLDGETDSLKQQNLVSIIVAPLRNTKATPKVVDSVAKLLALPFVLEELNSIELIQSVYIDVKLVPNLIYASKLLIYNKSTNDSAASLQNIITNRTIRSIGELSSEEMQTATRLYELICHLVHLKQQFLSQFCDAVAILAATELFINFLNHDFSNRHAVRIASIVLALCCCVLRERPENADLVEKIIFSSKLNLAALIENKNELLRIRMCMLFRLLGRFSLRGLQSVWSAQIRDAIDHLAYDDCSEEVRKEAVSTVKELKQFAFYT